MFNDNDNDASAVLQQARGVSNYCCLDATGLSETQVVVI
jgi:hypothetical protein